MGTLKSFNELASRLRELYRQKEEQIASCTSKEGTAMTCEDVKAGMAGYLDGLLRLSRKLLEKHLQSCAHCRRLAVETKNAVEWLQQAESLCRRLICARLSAENFTAGKTRRRRLALVSSDDCCGSVLCC